MSLANNPPAKRRYIPSNSTQSTSRATSNPTSAPTVADRSSGGGGEGEAARSHKGKQKGMRQGEDDDGSDVDGLSEFLEHDDLNEPRPTEQQLSNMSHEELVAFVLSGKQPSKAGAPAGESSRGRSQTPVVRKRKRVVPVSDDEVEAEVEEEGTEEAEVEAEGTEEAMTEDAKKSRKDALTTVARKSFCALGAWKDGTAVEPTQYDQNQQVSYWRYNSRGGRSVTPAWERDFGVNWGEWGMDFLKLFRLEAKKNSQAAYLARVSDDEIKERLREGAWSSYRTTGIRKAKGLYQDERTSHNRSSLEGGRQTTLLARRSEARVGTCVEGPEFDFLFVKSYQSRQRSDAEDSAKVTRLEPKWSSSLVAKLKSALDQKSLLKAKKARKPVVIVYVRVECELKALGDGRRYPLWAIDPQWRQDNAEDFEKCRYMIDMSATHVCSTTAPKRVFPTVARFLISKAG